MTSLNYCNDYDLELQAILPHLVSYPEILPFFGSSWKNCEERILFIAESHYLMPSSNDKSNHQTWYNNNNSSLTERDRININTRDVVSYADGYAVNKNNFHKSHSIFYHIKSAVFDALNNQERKRMIYNNFGYYNYFQRPAERTGESICNTIIDNEYGYHTLKIVCEIAKPTLLIFVSKKAFNSFKDEHLKIKSDVFNGIARQHVPHPASAWWNRKSKMYGNMSGKEKLINIIKGLDFRIL